MENQKPTYEELIDREVAEHNSIQALRNTRLAQSIPPDNVPKIEKLAKDVGLPFLFAAENPDIEDAQRAKQYRAASVTHPHTMSFMSKLENAAVAQDEVETLKKLEDSYIKQGTDIVRALPAGFLSEGVGTTLSGLGRIYDIRHRYLMQAADYLLPESMDEYLYTTPSSTTFQRAVQGALNPAEVFRTAGETFKAAGNYVGPDQDAENLATDISRGLGQFGFQAITAVFTGGAGVLATGAAQGADIVGEKVEGDDASQGAKDAAVIAGMGVTALTEKLGIDAILNRIPKAMKNKVMMYATDIAVAGGIEAAQEALESLMHDVIRKTLTNPDAPIGEDVVREMEVGAGVGSIARAFTQYVTKRNRNVDAPKKLKEQIQKESAAVQETKLSTRSPEKMQEYLSGKSDTDIYVDSAQAIELYQSLTPEERQEIERLMPELQRKLSESSLSGSDVQIKKSEYLAYIAPRIDLSDHIKINPEHLTYSQSQNFEARVTEAEELMRSFDPADALEQRVAGELMQTGRVRGEAASTVAASVRAVYDTMLQRGMGSESAQRIVQEAFQRLRFRGPSGADVVAENDIFRPVEFNSPDSLSGVLGYRPQSLSEFVGAIANADLPKITSDIKQAFGDVRQGTPKSRRPSSLIDFIRSRKEGGVFGIGDVAGEVRALSRKETGIAGLINTKRGQTLDEIGEAAFERGYFSERPTANEVLDAIQEELSGAPLVAAGEYDLAEYNAYIDDLANALAEKGLNPADMTDEQIQAALADVANTEADALRIAAERGFVDAEMTLEQFREALVRDAAGERTYAPEVLEDIEAYNQSLEMAFDGEGITLFQTAPPTDSKAFKKWFGDSKVVDADGKPLVVYHGTSESFGIFNTEGRGKSYGTGSFFSSNPMVAGTYAPRVGGSTVASYLSIQNPVVIDVGGGNWSSINATTAIDLPTLRENAGDKALLTELGIEDADTSSDARVVTVGDVVGVDVNDGTATTDKIARWARESGYDGVIFKNMIDRGPFLREGDAFTPSDVYIAFESNQIKSVNNRGTFDPNDARILYQGERGKIQLTPDGDSVITLLGNSDASTALHELGHFYWNRVLLPLSQLPDASDQIKQDAQTILDFAGVEPDATELTIEQEEVIARAFEAYLREGNAPSRGMESIFRQFKAWLMRIYKTVRNLNVTLNDDVREVFDRMLATDTEIEQYRGEDAFRADPEIAATLNAQELARYERMTQDAIDEAKEKLLRKALRQKEREQSEWYKEERAKAEEQVREEVSDSGLYSLLDYLQRSEAAGEKVEAFRINRKSVVDLIGEEGAKTMPSKTMVKSGGVPAELLADSWGFKSAESMLRGIAAAPSKEQRIKELTDREMIRRHGDMLYDGSLEREALNEVHNSGRLKVLEYEMSKVAELAGIPAVTAGEANALAAEIISRKSIDEAIKPHGYYQAELRAARAFGKALGQKDYAEAAVQKRRQMLNHSLYREARKAREMVEKSQRRFKKVSASDKKLARYRDMNLVNVARGVLTRFGLGTFEIDGAALANRIISDDPDVINDFDSQLLTDTLNLTGRNWRDLTVDEYRMVADTFDNLYTASKARMEIMMGEERAKINDIVDGIVNKINETHTPEKATKLRESGVYHDIKRNLAGFWAMQRKASFIARSVDGNKDNGLLWNAIIRPMNDAENQRAERMTEATKKLKEIMSQHYSQGELLMLKRRKLDVGIGEPITHEQALSLLLNWGNEANRERVLHEELITSEADMEAVFNALEKRDFDFAQDVWDFIDSFWPDIKALELRTRGYAPEKQEAMPIRTRFGMYRGGYYPIVYDAEQSPEAEARIEEDFYRDTLRGVHVASQTKRGHTRERMRSVNQNLKLDLSLNPMFRHVDQVIYDLSYREAVNQANRVLRHAELKKRMFETYGPEIHSELRDWLRAIATQDKHKKKKGDTFMQSIRVGAGINFLGLNLMTAVSQLTGFSHSMVRVGPKYMARALAETYGTHPAQMAQNIQEVYEASPAMRHRAQSINREVAEARNALGVNMKLRDGSTRFAYYALAKMQMLVDVPTWKAGYRKALDEGKSHEDAVAIADQTVLDTQSGGSIKDLADVQRGNEFKKLFTLFYSYYNVKFNLANEALARTDFTKPKDVARFASDYFALFFVDGMVYSILKGYMPEDDESISEWALLIGLNEALSSIFIVREATGSLAGFFDYGGPAGLNFFNAFGRFAKQAEQGEIDEAAIRSAGDVVGVAARLPVRSMFNLGKGINDLAEGETEDVLSPFGRRANN